MEYTTVKTIEEMIREGLQEDIFLSADFLHVEHSIPDLT